MNYSEIIEMGQRYQDKFAIAQRAAEHDGSDGEVYACTGDTYFQSLEFMSREQVEHHITFWEDEPEISHAEGVWAATEQVDMDN